MCIVFHRTQHDTSTTITSARDFIKKQYKMKMLWMYNKIMRRLDDIKGPFIHLVLQVLASNTDNSIVTDWILVAYYSTSWQVGTHYSTTVPHQNRNMIKINKKQSKWKMQYVLNYLSHKSKFSKQYWEGPEHQKKSMFWSNMIPTLHMYWYGAFLWLILYKTEKCHNFSLYQIPHCGLGHLTNLRAT